MSSNPELSDASPSDSTLEDALRAAAIQALKTGDAESATINKIRAATEQRLGLANDFFKTSSSWKARSKSIISAAAEEVENPADHPKISSPTPPRPTKQPKGKPELKKATQKRSSIDTASKPRKRQKRAVSDDDLDSQDAAESQSAASSEEKPAQKTRGNRAIPVVSINRKSVISSESEDGDRAMTQDGGPGDDAEEKEPGSVHKDAETAQTADSESEMSDVLDEPVVRKEKRGKDSSTTQSKTKSSRPVKGAKVAKPTAPKDQSLPPDEAEIKRLQSWLIKCGIRKLWHKELERYDTAKSKIKHLKDMLKDAGMDGRYSVEKANAIKEQRELAADLEAVQQGAKKWGHESGSDEGDVRPTRRRPVTSRFVDFGDDGEESE